MEPQVLTVEAAAKYLSLSCHSIYKAVRRGHLKTLDVRGRHILFTSVQLDEYVEFRRQRGMLDGELTPADGVRMVELAKVAGLSHAIIRNSRQLGKLSGVKLNGKVLIPWAEARRFLEARGVDAGDRLTALRAEKEADAA